MQFILGSVYYGTQFENSKKEDVDILYDWANDPVTRKNSFSEEPINYQTHVTWFNSCMDNPYCIQFLLEIDDKVVGQARLNINNNEALISYSIVPNYRCRGYAKILRKHSNMSA